MNANNSTCSLSNDTELPGKDLTLKETLDALSFGVNAIVKVFPKLPNETLKCIDLRFIKELTRTIDQEVEKGN